MSNFLLNSKSNVAVYQGHINFRKELPKCSQSAGCKKYVSVTAIVKLMPANLSILTITKFKNQNLSKANINVF